MRKPLPFRTQAERTAATGALAEHLTAGGIVAYPTETVYGLGCALQREPLLRMTELKGDRPFLVLVRGREDAPGLRWTADADRLAERFWPGPLTLALADPEGRYPEQVRGPGGSVAVRVSPHAGVADLLDSAGGVVTSTSANLPGEAPALDAAESTRIMDAIPDLFVLDGGRLPRARPSTIVACGRSVRMIREGAISRADLESVVELE